MNTKEKILKTSLLLFSNNGFDSVSIRDIAASVGIKSSSIYNHFESKQDIFDSIIKKYSKKNIQLFKRISSGRDAEELLYYTNNFSDLNFTKISVKIFKYYLEDESLILFRKMLSIERFSNKQLHDLYTKLYIDNFLSYYSKVFKIIIDKNLFSENNPEVLALEFYSPIFLLFNKMDKPSSKDMENIKKHVINFKNYYTMKG